MGRGADLLRYRRQVAHERRLWWWLRPYPSMSPDGRRKAAPSTISGVVSAAPRRRGSGVGGSRTTRGRSPSRDFAALKRDSEPYSLLAVGTGIRKERENNEVTGERRGKDPYSEPCSYLAGRNDRRRVDRENEVFLEQKLIGLLRFRVSRVSRSREVENLWLASSLASSSGVAIPN